MPLKNSHGALDTTEVNENSGLGPVVLGGLLFKNGEGLLGTSDTGHQSGNIPGGIRGTPFPGVPVPARSPHRPGRTRPSAETGSRPGTRPLDNYYRAATAVRAVAERGLCNLAPDDVLDTLATGGERPEWAAQITPLGRTVLTWSLQDNPGPGS
ncbi:hypothetical protein [Kitasatospora purpeofusca]|uniref:hypothetical protein n=1 Tax=Kitasatospora purpeofusca TaxID=67352 RepID=UPI003F4AC9B3